MYKRQVRNQQIRSPQWLSTAHLLTGEHDRFPNVSFRTRPTPCPPALLCRGYVLSYLFRSRAKSSLKFWSNSTPYLNAENTSAYRTIGRYSLPVSVSRRRWPICYQTESRRYFIERYLGTNRTFLMSIYRNTYLPYG